MSMHESPPSSDIKQLSDEELEKYLEIAVDGTAGKMLAREELTRRQRANVKFYWNQTFLFIIVVIAFILAAIVTFFVVRRLSLGHPATAHTARLPQTLTQSQRLKQSAAGLNCVLSPTA